MLYVGTHSIKSLKQPIKQVLYYPHFTEEETQAGNDSPKVTQLVGSRAGI